MVKAIYLDNATVARPSAHTVNEMIPFYTTLWGSPSSPHRMGHELQSALTTAYKSLYTLVGAEERDTILFTSSGAEAINHALFSAFYDCARTTGKNQIISSHLEDAPTIVSMSRLEPLGCVSKFATPNNKGVITPDCIADALSPRTAMVSLSWAHGLTGVLQPISDIADLCKERGVLFHIDATHVLGKLFFNLSDIGADFISFGGDPLHAPKGTGGLYIKHGTKCTPFIVGGAEQGGWRAGSINVPGLVGLGYAATEAIECRDLVCTEVARFRNKLETGIVAEYPEAISLFQDQERIPTCTAIAFPGIANEAMLYALNRQQLYATIGGGHFQQIHYILTAAGVPESLARTAISFSLSRDTTESEIEQAINIISSTARRLRTLSNHMIRE